jgi:hypothetical protein|tara:strand:+ start:533 stop:721 length:189 start_codon:yes stop_codon:yes gene_type:complete
MKNLTLTKPWFRGNRSRNKKMNFTLINESLLDQSKENQIAIVSSMYHINSPGKKLTDRGTLR